MVFTTEDKIQATFLKHYKGYSAKNTSVSLSNGRVHHRSDSAERNYGSGRKRTAHTSENVDAVEELILYNIVLSQEDAPASETHRTVRHLTLP